MINKINKYNSFVRVILILLSPFNFNNAIACSDACISLANYGNYDSESWWIPGAELKSLLAHKTFLSEIRKGRKVQWENNLYAFDGHSLSNGKGDVLTFYRIFKGWNGVSDASNFIRITVYILEPLRKNGKIEIGKDSGTIVFFSGGVPSFRDFCIGYALTGTIEYHTYNPDTFHYDEFEEYFYKKVLNIDNGVVAKISMEFSPGDTKKENVSCKRCSFNADLLFKLNDISSFNDKLVK